jgi:hypothetical protein
LLKPIPTCIAYVLTFVESFSVSERSQQVLDEVGFFETFQVGEGLARELVLREVRSDWDR